MGRFVGFLSAVGVVLAIWAILAGVGFAFGVVELPEFGSAEPADDATDAAPDDEDETEDVAQADNEDDEDETAAEDDASDETAVTPAEPDEPPRVDVSLSAFTLCQSATASDVTMTLSHVVGGPEPEIIVGCGGRFTLLTTTAAGADSELRLSPQRVGSFSWSSTAEGQVHAGHPAVGDVDGDTLADLVSTLR